MLKNGFGGVVGVVSFVAWLGMSATEARAQDPPAAGYGAPPPGYEPPPPPSPYEQVEPVRYQAPQPAPSFMTLDRVDATSRFGVQLGFNKIDAIDLGDAFFLRFTPHGQYVLPSGQGGVYAQAPISHAFLDGDDATGFANPEVGGFLLPMRNNDLILRGGLIAGIGSDSGNEAGANGVTAYERMTDFLQAGPDYWTLRLSASTIREEGTFFLRADGGFDVVVSRPSDPGDGPSAFFRGNVGAGVHAQGVDLLGELVNYAAVNGDVDGGLSGRFIHSLALGLRTQGETQVHVGAVFPLDEELRGEIWILTLGLMQALR